jgi:hypothetical protein
MPKDRYEDEIRDLLNHMDNFIPDEGETRNRPRPRPSRSGNSGSWMNNFRRKLYGYSSETFLVAWVVLALLAAVLHKIYPPFGAIAAILSVGCLLAALFLPMISRSYGQPERRWRGRVIDTNPTPIRRPFSWRYVWWRIKHFFGFR